MIDHAAMRAALRTRALTLAVCTTGSTTLAATATGYTRAAGSFITDGFRPGMEILAAGFGTAANNGTGVVTGITATTLTVTAYTVAWSASVGRQVATSRTLVTEAASAGRTISVALPVMRAWENSTFEAEPGVPHVAEQYIPGPSRQVSIGPLGILEGRPMYALHVHVPAEVGAAAPDEYADAILTLFTSRTALAVGSDWLRVRTDTGPYMGQIQQGSPGFAVVPVTVPLWIRTANSI